MSIADEIKKLNDLLEDGAISQEEFEKEKAKLLGNKRNSPPPRVLITVLVLAGIFWISGLGAGEDRSSKSSIEVESTFEVSRCARVSQSFLDQLAGNDGFDLKNGYVVNSDSFQDNWSFVSAEAINSGSLGIDGEVLTWFVDQYPDANYIEGVGGFGEAYSSWGASGQNQSSTYDDGYSESRDCVK